ncbi:MAG TPA: glycoside hydrolase family 32 protein [Terriglobales bacterium]|nr:glycoside hydrolase family 32 protein [Terriglobales bacterium]
MWATRLKKSFSAFLFLLAVTLAAAQRSYQERYRPQVHFSPREHWTNDPNGLVYFHGEYHLFFQFNPFGDEWGHMSWGHAISTDLLHWHELPVAIPEMGNEMAFTGSIVVDRKNTSGLCSTGKECLVAVYTGHRTSPGEVRQTQNLAYSLDDGRTWTRYAQNPVLDLHLADFRDPSVSWDEKEGHWLMAVSLPAEHKIAFYTSPDLKQWTQVSDFGPAGDVDGVWECPDLLHLPAESGSAGTWVLKVGINPGAPHGGSGEQYFLGTFDGKRFVPFSAPGLPARSQHGWTNYGKDDYCAISFNGLLPGDRPILMGWMNNWQYAAKLPTSPWRGQMSLPRRLSLFADRAGLALRQEPITAPLRSEHRAIRQPVAGQVSVQEAPFELDLLFEISSEEVFGIRLYTDARHWIEIGFDRAKREFYTDRTQSGIAVSPDFLTKTIAELSEDRPYDLKVIVDRSSIEAFAQSGTIAMTNLVFPPSDRNRLVVFSASGKPISVSGDVWKLRSIWK